MPGLGIPIAWLGIRRVLPILRVCPLPKPEWLSAGLLMIPPVGSRRHVRSALIPELARSPGLVIGAAFARAVINATAEELLWRGIAVAKLSGRGLMAGFAPRCYLWPFMPRS
ncbi:MAG: hypothetical protein RL701_4163 [Pseudomonadota bacterium]